eukprot:2185148-Prymnesium_polylepis.1
MAVGYARWHHVCSMSYSPVSHRCSQYKPSWEIYETQGDLEWSRCLMCNRIVGPYPSEKGAR